MRDLTLIRKNIARKKMRLLLLLLSIFIAFFLYGILTSLQSSFSADNVDGQADRLVVANKINFTQPLPIGYVEKVRQIPGVKSATHASWFGGYYQEPRNFVVSFASDLPTHFQVFSELRMPEREFEACKIQRTGLAVGRTVADQFGWKIGQNVVLQSSIFQQRDGGRAWKFEVCGIYEDSANTGADNQVVFQYDYLNETRSFAQDTTDLITVVPVDPANSQGVAEAIDRNFANSSDETDTVTEKQFAAAFLAQFGDIGLMVTLVVGAAFITILMIVGSTMILAVQERTREFGILKTLGFPNSRLLKIVVSETLLITTIGGLAGLIAAQGAVLGLANSGQFAGLKMSTGTWMSGLLWIVLLGLLTAGIPAYKALKLNIVTALGRN